MLLLEGERNFATFPRQTTVAKRPTWGWWPSFVTEPSLHHAHAWTFKISFCLTVSDTQSLGLILPPQRENHSCSKAQQACRKWQNLGWEVCMFPCSSLQRGDFSHGWSFWPAESPVLHSVVTRKTTARCFDNLLTPGLWNATYDSFSASSLLLGILQALVFLNWAGMP